MKFEYLEKGKPEITEKILRSLPDWFGIEESTAAYIEKSKELPMVIAYESGEPIGFISIKNHSPFTSELYVMGVDPKFHRKSCGSKMVEEVERVLSTQGVEFLQVKTLSEGRESEFYKKTRLFYKSQGFREVEVFPTLWDKSNPCLLMIKGIT